jgi:hypothetical protein
VGHDDPELGHADSPCSAHTESRWMLGAPHAHARLEKSLRIAHSKNNFAPTGGYNRPLAVVITHRQSRIALSGLSKVSSFK